MWDVEFGIPEEARRCGDATNGPAETSSAPYCKSLVAVTATAVTASVELRYSIHYSPS